MSFIFKILLVIVNMLNTLQSSWYCFMFLFSRILHWPKCIIKNKWKQHMLCEGSSYYIQCHHQLSGLWKISTHSCFVKERYMYSWSVILNIILWTSCSSAVLLGLSYGIQCHETMDYCISLRHLGPYFFVYPLDLGVGVGLGLLVV